MKQDLNNSDSVQFGWRDFRHKIEKKKTVPKKQKILLQKDCTQDRIIVQVCATQVAQIWGAPVLEKVFPLRRENKNLKQKKENVR